MVRLGISCLVVGVLLSVAAQSMVGQQAPGGRVDAEIKPELVLRSENGAFSTYAMSPNGLWYAAYGDSQLRIYSTTDGLLYRTIPIGKRDAQAQSVAVLGNGNEILVAGKTGTDGRARVLRFRVMDGTRLPDLLLPDKGLVTRVACDAKDDKVALVVTQDITPDNPALTTRVKVLHAGTGEQLFETHRLGLLHATLALSGDGMKLGFAYANEFRVFDVRAGAKSDGLVLTQALHPDSESVVVFSPSAALVAVQQSGIMNKKNDPTPSLQIFRTADGLAMPPVKDDVEGVDFLDEGHLLASEPYEFKVVDAKTGTAEHLWPGHKDLVARVMVTADRRRVLLGTQRNSEIDAYPAGTTVGDGPIPIQRSYEFGFRKDNSTLVTSGEWDLQSGEYRGVGDTSGSKPVVSPDGRYVARVGTSGLQVSALGGLTKPLPPGDSGQWYLAAFTADSKLLAAAFSPYGMGPHEDEIRLLHLPDLQQVGVVKIPVDTLKYVDHFAFSPDGRLAAAAVQENVIAYKVSGTKLTELKRFALPKEIHTIPQADGTRTIEERESPYGRMIASLAFSPNGKHLAVASSFLHVYSTETWLAEGETVQQPVSCVQWMPDGTRLMGLVGPDERTMTYENEEQPAQFSAIDLATRKVVATDTSARIGCPAVMDAEGRVIAAFTPDGVALYSATDFALLGTMYEFTNGEWMFATPSGLFDGTPGAWKYLSWRLSGKTFELTPIEVFFREFYRPGLLADVFAGRQVKAPPTALANVDRRQPMVKLEAQVAGATANVRVQASEGGKGSGVRDLRLFRNGVLVKVWRGEMMLDAAGGASVAVDVPIVMGENRFTAYGFNDGDVKSQDAETTVTGGEALARKGVAYVVTIGINRYGAHTAEHPLNLTYAEADAKDFAEAFSVAQEKLGEFAEIRVIPLLSEAATRANIEATLGVLAGKSKNGLTAEQSALLKEAETARPEDGLFLFYAGHGIASESHFYLLPTDIKLLGTANPQSRTLSDEALSGMLEGIGAGRGFVVIDACHSGKALEGEDAGGGPTNARGLAQLAYEKGMDILTASQTEEKAGENQKLAGGHGYLTYALVEEGLKKSEAASEGRVELRGWFRFASRRVPELLAEPGTGDEIGQHPRAFYRKDVEKHPFVVATQ